MAKYYNNKIKSGKLAGSVFAVRYGDVIERAYNPFVANPKTEGQVKARAKLKLLSQMSAAYAPVMAIRRQGAVSPRNIFTRLNMQYTDYADNQAIIQLADVLLTNSMVGMSGFSVVRSAADGLQVSLTENVTAMWERVTYVVVAKTSSQVIYVKDVKTVSEAGENGTFPVEFPYLDGAIAIYAYGVRFNTAAARVKFDQMMTETGNSFAQVYVRTSMNEEDVIVSETRGVYMEVGVDSAATTGVRSIEVITNVINPEGAADAARGTVTGGGSYPQGADVRLVATPNTGYRFVRWFFGTNDPRNVDTNPLTLQLNETTSVAAIFATED